MLWRRPICIVAGCCCSFRCILLFIIMKNRPGTCCIVPKCSMRPGTNLLSKVKTFAFPTEISRRKKWIAAVRREKWLPTPHSRICSRHFLEGKPSEDPLHPDWVPSIFPFNRKITRQKQLGMLARYYRTAKRQKNISDAESTSNSNQEVEENKENTISEKEESNEMDCNEGEHLACVQHADLKNAMTQTFEMAILEMPTQENEFSSDRLSVCEILSSDKWIRYYTGLGNVGTFATLIKCFSSFWSIPSYGNLKAEEQLLAVLMRLRLGLDIQDLAFHFSVSARTISVLFYHWIDTMALNLASFIRWPTRKAVKKGAPEAFNDDLFSNVIGIVDCSEIFIEKPSCLQARAQTYSHYKGHNTIKFLVVVAPCGAITFISKCWGGRVSDKELTKRCGVLDLLQNGDVLADRGFLCEELLAAKGAKLLIPASTKGKVQLSAEEVIISRKLSHVRIHVERAIRRLKTFKFLSGTIPISALKKPSDTKLSSADKILIVIAALCNLQSPIISH